MCRLNIYPCTQKSECRYPAEQAVTALQKVNAALKSFGTTVTASVCSLQTEAPTSGCIKPTSRTICHSQLSPLRNKRRLMKKQTRGKLWSVYSSVKQSVVSVQFCQAICGMCTVMSSNLCSMYSSIKKFVVSVQFCQTICGKCTVLLSNLRSMYSSVKQFVESVQFY